MFSIGTSVINILNNQIALRTHAQNIIGNIQQLAEENSGDYDYISFYEGLLTINTITGKVLSILVTLITILVPLMISLEVCYVSFSPFREVINRVLTNSGGALHGAFQFTFKDAQEAVRREAVYGTSKALLEYLKIKVKSIYIIVFVIALTLSGNGFLLRCLVKLLAPLISSILSVMGVN